MSTAEQTHFAFVVEQPGHAMHGADVIIQAADETEAERLAIVRSNIYRAPLRRARDEQKRSAA